MRVIHSKDTEDGRRLTYHSPSHGRWSTPSAPTFDAVGAPKRNTYRPNAEPIHSSDVAIAEAMRDNRKAVRKADKVYAKSQGKVNPRPVILRRLDGSYLPTFKHAEAITARVVTQPKQMSKKVDISTVTQSATYQRPGTYYPPLPKDRPTVPTVLAVETVEPIARTRTVRPFEEILDRITR